MWTEEAKIVAGMALLRFLAGTIEVAAAVFMLRLGRIEAAFQINAILGMIGPTILVIVSALGLVGLAGRVPISKLLLIAAGVTLILIAARK